MPVRGLRVQKYTQNMAVFGDVDQAEAHFLAPYYQFKLQQCQPDFIHHPGCAIDEHISLSMVKWV